MKCIASPALDDAQIVSYLDGEADESAAAHIKECPFCTEKAERWGRLQNRLRARLYRINCPPPMELGEYHLGLLTPSQAGDVKKHVSECPLCRDEVAQLEKFLEKPAPPQASSSREIKKFIARLVGGGREEQGPGGLSLAPAFAGLRGEGKGTLILEADGIVIVLDVQPATDAEGRVNILGQIAGDDQDPWTGALVALRRAGTLQVTAVADELGAFRFEGILPGLTEFEITSSSGATILAPDIDIII